MTLPPPKAAAELSERSTNAARMVPSSGFAPLAERELPKGVGCEGGIYQLKPRLEKGSSFLERNKFKKRSGNSP